MTRLEVKIPQKEIAKASDLVYYLLLWIRSPSHYSPKKPDLILNAALCESDEY